MRVPLHLRLKNWHSDRLLAARTFSAGPERGRQEFLLGFHLRQLQRFSEVGRGRLRVVQARLEFPEHGVKEVVGLQ